MCQSRPDRAPSLNPAARQRAACTKSPKIEQNMLTAMLRKAMPVSVEVGIGKIAQNVPRLRGRFQFDLYDAQVNRIVVCLVVGGGKLKKTIANRIDQAAVRQFVKLDQEPVASRVNAIDRKEPSSFSFTK